MLLQALRPQPASVVQTLAIRSRMSSIPGLRWPRTILTRVGIPG